MRDGRRSVVKRLLLRWLHGVLPADWATDIIRDLDEAHGHRSRMRGGVGADLWLIGQTVLFTGRFGLEQALEAVRAKPHARSGGALRGDVLHAFRALRASPAFFAGVIATLAIGIGANTAVFSIVNTVVFESLPYPGSDRLVMVEPNGWTPASIVLELERSGDSFEDLVGFYPRPFVITEHDGSAELAGAVVTPDFFGFFGADMALGRPFGEADARPEAPRTVVISHGTWQRRFGGSPDLVGRVLRIDDELRVVIGVAGEDFRQLTPRTDEPEIWIPAAMGALGADVLPEGAPGWAIPIGRLRASVPMSRAQSDLDRAVARSRASNPAEQEEAPWDFRLARLESHLTDGVRPALLILQAAVGVVLLLACVNVANLLLVRFASRTREVAIRAALGASRGRLFRQLLTESMLLSLLGGLAGLGLMVACLEVFLAIAPADIPRIGEVAIDAPVLLFTLTVAVVTGLSFGIVPALIASRQAPWTSLLHGGRTVGSRRKRRLSQSLVVAEITLTMVLVVAAALLVRSFASLAGQPPGFRTEDILTARLHVPPDRYPTVPLLEDFYRSLVERLRDVPGMEVVAMANRLPIDRGGSTRAYSVEGETEPRQAVHYAVVSPGYFAALEIPVLKGRAIEDADRRGAPPVTVVDEALARTVWPGEDAIGKRFRFAGTEPWYTVVGVAGGIRGNGLAREPEAGFYISYQQRLETAVELGVGRTAVLLARTRVDPSALSEALRQVVLEIDPGQPVPDIRTLEGVVSQTLGPHRFRALLVGSFAAIAIVLAMAGIYGVVSHLLGERAREFGIRKAIGATGGDILRDVLGWGLSLAALGTVLGLLGVYLLMGYLTSLLFGVTPTDPLTIAGAAAGIFAVTLLACLVPALRAVGADPLVALASE